MNWKLSFKEGCRKQKRETEAFTQDWLDEKQDLKPQQIIESEVRKKLSVVSEIADQGIDEKNRLKAVLSWLRFSRQLSEVQKIEVEGSLNLETVLHNRIAARERAEKIKVGGTD